MGFLLSAFGLALFMAGSTTLGLNLVPVGYVLVLIVAGGALLAAYILRSRRVDNPIIDLSLLRIPTLGNSMLGTLLFRIGVGATPFLLPLLLQVGFGMSPFESGMITFAAAIGAIAMKFAAPPILRRFGFRNVLIVNAVIAGGFVMLPAIFTPATPVVLMTGLLLVGGFFRSLQFTSVNALAFADVPNDRMSRATTLTSVAQQLSLSIGVSVGAMALELTVEATGGDIGPTSFVPAFLVVGGLTVLSAIPFALLARDAGREMSGHRRIAPDPVTVMRDRG